MFLSYISASGELRLEWRRYSRLPGGACKRSEWRVAIGVQLSLRLTVLLPRIDAGPAVLVATPFAACDVMKLLLLSQSRAASSHGSRKCGTRSRELVARGEYLLLNGLVRPNVLRVDLQEDVP